MAVFTDVTPAEAGALTERLGAGALLQLQGISAGIENSNFFVTTSQGDWVLTLFERLRAEQLPYYLQLMQHLAQRGLPVPEPRADAAGQILHQVAGKPAALVTRLRGHHQLAPDLHHCAQLGSLLARMHLAVADFPLQQPNLRGRAWWHSMAPAVRPYLSASAAAAAGRRAGLPAAGGSVRHLRRPAPRCGACRPVLRQRAVRRPARP